MATAGYCIGTFLVTLSLLMKTGHSIECYRCTSINNSRPFQCNEFLTSDVDLLPESCKDVYGAQYCVKHVGRFEGKQHRKDILHNLLLGLGI
ncbi:hypothetical protein EAG_03543 [Camponotus floridanus]|uniref:Protein sleepless n=1 Tax=Camponotus floridanus TaxID=104421 RepID=E1ZVU5_CAMFO|nr:hypothetical protein EAG_03543 [Camponotus floridanus]